MPGFSRGLESLNLAKNINLITGPNASGKSSTSRVIQKVIWPDKTKGLDVHSQLEIGGDSWQVRIESEAVKIQQDGIDQELKGIPAKKGCHRYLLPLHELIKEEEGDLAKEIMKASIGGYDLDEAKNKLDYSHIVKNSGASEFKEVIRRDREYKEIQQNHKSLKKEEEALNNLKADKERAQKASLLYKFYNSFSELIIVKQSCENFSSQKNRYPSSMDQVTGEELGTIEDLDNQFSEAEANIQFADAKIEEEKQKIEDLKIAGKDIPESTISNLETRLGNLQNISQKLTGLETDLFAEHETRCDFAKAIDPNLDPFEWERLDLEKVENLGEFIQNAYRVVDVKVNLENEINRLQEEFNNSEDIPVEHESILQGIKYLGFWIKEQETVNNIPNWLLPGLAILGILTGIATFFIGWPGLFGILMIIGIALYGSKAKHTLNSHVLREKDFKDLNLPLPNGWTIDLVTDHVDHLSYLLRLSKFKEEIALRIKDLNREFKKSSHEVNKIHDEHKKWRDEIGTAPELKENDFGSLYWFLSNARNWQISNAAYKALEGKKSANEKQLKKELLKFNALLQECNLKLVSDETEAHAELKNLKNQISSKSQSESIISNQQLQLNGYRRSKKEALDKLSVIYKRLIVPQGDKAEVKKLIENLADYKNLCQNLFASEQKRLDKQSILESCSLYNEFEDSLESLTLDQAEEKARENHDVAGKLEEISSEITRIQTLINDKKKGHELEDLLTEKESALDGLLSLYQKNMAAVTGDLLVEQLKAETQEQNRPEVFKRANVLFNKFTIGRYELRLDEKDNPSFTAFDTVLKQGLNLSEVSTGTRVHLLLAVRLAYVESLENGIKLPILADELLANSDDKRAAAIIKALIEISREGRQVFYFTAQADEIYKWENILKEETELEYKVISLNDHRNLSEDLYRPLEKFKFQESILEPGTLSHSEYGRQLKVEVFNPLFQDSAQLHLWYLIDDPQLLYNCLNIGLKTWGQLESFSKANGEIEGMTSQTKTKLINKITLLDRLIYLSRKGRAIIINREVLENSGAISTSFIDEVSEKMKELNGDPEALLEALENSEVSGFRRNNIDKLKKYLSVQEIMHEEESLSEGEITTQLTAFISRLEIPVKDAEGFCNQFVTSDQVDFAH